MAMMAGMVERAQADNWEVGFKPVQQRVLLKVQYAAALCMYCFPAAHHAESA